MHTTLIRFAGLTLLTSAASAQAPEIIHYTFDAGDATNTATPGVGDGVANGDVVFGPGFCGSGAATAGPGGAPLISSGWQVDFGTDSWTIGMWIDLSVGGNGFQYFYGASSTGGMRCFCAGAAGVDGIMLRTLQNDVTLPGGAPSTGPTHCVWVYDNTVPEVRGYVNGVNVVTVAQTAPININGTAADFNVMTYTTTEMLAGNTMDDFRVYRRAITQAEVDAWFGSCAGGVGSTYCGPAVVNSTGASASISASGSALVSNNDVTLMATGLPTNSFGFFITSMTQGLVPQAGGSQGVLCLGGNIGRFVGAGQIQNSGMTGEIMLALDLTQQPTPTGIVSVMAGETWNFQGWYRDAIGGNGTSNFTDGLQVNFQ
ncbi:MAG: LamG-like jellyroll fold domain-containing protein [Planctomycetota bacterium]